jgi:X-Pro dipeptidyl-peptidase
MKQIHLALCCLISLNLSALPASSEVSEVVKQVVYVESPTDTDRDGKLDRIYVSIKRGMALANLPVIYTISPYSLGGNDVDNHPVDFDRLPQDEALSFLSLPDIGPTVVNKEIEKIENNAVARGYASVSAHSLGTGYSKGCPTVGDQSETLAAKAVIDWLNGRSKAYTRGYGGTEVVADWSNGSVGMVGVSYNGTLPNMVATTGVEGLNAIIPVAAISSWYDYYRANGLVVGPGGYVGEDADVLGKYIVRRGGCQAEMNQMTGDMGRDHGDFTEFWQDRDYVKLAEHVTAAVFIVHGQSDDNVRQRHAIEWWNALEGLSNRRMWLHNGGHEIPRQSNYDREKWAWFDRFVKGVENGTENDPEVQVQYSDGSWHAQDSWPHEAAVSRIFYFGGESQLSETALAPSKGLFRDSGKTNKIVDLMKNPELRNDGRVVFLTDPLSENQLLTGTPKVTLKLSVQNRKAANITVALFEYPANGQPRELTRGWVDPQNHADLTYGQMLIPGEEYEVKFSLEPEQIRLSSGSRIGVLVAATDRMHTIRPNNGTEISLSLGQDSFIELMLAR